MIDEKVEELKTAVERGKMMQALSETEGWKNLLFPYIQGLKKSAMDMWLQKEDVTSAKVYITANTIETYVATLIKMGEDAKEELRKERNVRG